VNVIRAAHGKSDVSRIGEDGLDFGELVLEEDGVAEGADILAHLVRAAGADQHRGDPRVARDGRQLKAAAPAPVVDHAALVALHRIIEKCSWKPRS
jgi:hypothetical protein